MTEWVGVAGVAVGVIGVVVAAVAWRRPRAPKAAPPPAHETVRVSKGWAYPTWVEATDPASSLVEVRIANGSARPVQVTGWGLRLPNGKQLISPAPVFHFDPSLPHWVEAGTGATWHMISAGVEQILDEAGFTHDDLVPFVHLADGRTITG